MSSDDQTSERTQGRPAADTFEQHVQTAVKDAQQRVSDTIRPAAQQVQTFAQRQKVAGAEQLGGVARAVHGAAREFEDELPQVARSVHDAAASLDRAASSLREKSAAELVASFNEFGRSRPGLLLGAAIVAGFAASRFLKSSRDAGIAVQQEMTS